jgi:plastocyanin
MKPAAAMLVAWLALSPLLLSLQPAHSDVPYFGILRGWENSDVEKSPVRQMTGYDIAADESGIYIAGEYFIGPGYGPMVLFLNPDHTFRCQKILQFKVTGDFEPRVDLFTIAGPLSIALNSTHVIVAGVYFEFISKLQVARLFVAVFEKDTCERTGLIELTDSALDWENPYYYYFGGIKVVWDDPTKTIFIVLQTTANTRHYLYIIRVPNDLSFSSLQSERYSGLGQAFFVSDVVADDSLLHFSGFLNIGESDKAVFYGSIDKTDLLLKTLYYFDGISFPGYDVEIPSPISIWSPRIVLTSSDEATSGKYVNIAFTIQCLGRDCNGGVNAKTYRLALLNFSLEEDPTVKVKLYNWSTTHWNTPSPYRHTNNTWIMRIVKADNMLYMIGFLGSAPNIREDGFVYAVDARTLNPQYMLRVVSLDGPPSDGGKRVPSAVLGAGSYNGYAYITGTAGNYYLELTPFNPSNITGTATRERQGISVPDRPPVFRELRNFQGDVDNTPVFDQDAHPRTAGFYGVLRLKPATTTTSTTTSTATSTTTRTVTSTPTTTVTRFTTSTQTAVATVVQTEYVFSTVYTTRVVEGTVTRVETVTSVTTIPYVTTLTDTTTVRSVVTATTTPVVYATLQTTIMRNTTTYLTTTKAVQPPDTVPWWYILFPFIPLLLLPPIVATTRGRLKITILEGAGEQQPGAQPSDILSEYFKPSVGRLQKNGKATFINKDRATHTVEIYTPEEPGRIKTLTVKPGQKAQIKFKEPGRYFFRLQTNPDKIGILQVE